MSRLLARSIPTSLFELKEIIMDNLSQFPLTLNLANMGLVVGSTDTLSVKLAPSSCINGKFCTITLSASDNQAITPTLDAATGLAFPPILINTCAAIVYGLNLAGTLVAVQGTALPTEVGVTTTAGAFISAPQFPGLPDNFVPVAYQIVRVAPSGTGGFTLGVSPWTGSASYATCTTIQNIVALPNRPQIA
jgi:hypothetical protein